MPSIDKKSYQPAYSQLVDILKQQIESGKFKPGSRLPSESEMRRLYDVSAVTIRRAISILVEEGVVETSKGKGTFVRHLDLDTAAFDLGNIQDIFQDHTSTQIKLLYTRIIRADALIARKLKINKDDRVINIRRMISKYDLPLIFHQQYLIYDPRKPVVEDELNLTSLQGLFESSKTASLKKGLLNLKVTALDEKTAGYFNKKAGEPAFHLEHQFFDLNDNVISWGWFCFFNESLEFCTRVGMWQS